MVKKKNKKIKKIISKKNNLALKKIFLLKIFLSSLLLVFLFFNIFFSQNISPLYQKLINEERKAVVEYLKNIKSLPVFKTELKKFTSIFGKQIASEVFFEDEQRKIKIKKLEAVLQKNPKSRDVLYALSKLYKEDGNDRLAKEYLDKAKEIDPDLIIAVE